VTSRASKTLGVVMSRMGIDTSIFRQNIERLLAILADRRFFFGFFRLPSSLAEV
jgi:hypothetical protein